MKVFAVLGLVVIVLLVVGLVVGGEHGPGRHFNSGDSPERSAPAAAPESSGTGGHTPPAGDHTPPAGGHNP